MDTQSSDIRRDLDTAIDKVIQALSSRGAPPSIEPKEDNNNKAKLDAILQTFRDTPKLQQDEHLLMLFHDALCQRNRLSHLLFEQSDKKCKRWTPFPASQNRIQRRHEIWRIIRTTNLFLRIVENWHANVIGSGKNEEADRKVHFEDVPTRRRCMPNDYHLKLYLHKAVTQGYVLETCFVKDVKAEIKVVIRALQDHGISRSDLIEVKTFLLCEKYLTALMILNLLFEKHNLHTEEALLVRLLVKAWQTLLLYRRVACDRCSLPNGKGEQRKRLKKCTDGWKVAEHWNDCHCGESEENYNVDPYEDPRSGFLRCINGPNIFAEDNYKPSYFQHRC